MMSQPLNAPGGEIDVFEQLGRSPPLNPDVERFFHFTLHDRAGGTTPFAFAAMTLPDLTAGYHRDGLLRDKSHVALYFDDKLLTSTPTPSVMIDRKYFLQADLGIGSGRDTTQTPTPSDMVMQYIRAYSAAGFLRETGAPQRRARAGLPSPGAFRIPPRRPTWRRRRQVACRDPARRAEAAFGGATPAGRFPGPLRSRG
jgi:hypothetical protein